MKGIRLRETLVLDPRARVIAVRVNQVKVLFRNNLSPANHLTQLEKPIEYLSKSHRTSSQICVMKIITVVLTVLPPFAACGCYTSGEEWDRDLAPPALEEACNQLAGDYKFPGEKTADIPIDNGKMIYTFKLTGLRKLDSDLAPVRHIDAEECREGMNKELFGCKQGGKSEYTNWRYRYV